MASIPRNLALLLRGQGVSPAMRHGVTAAAVVLLAIGTWAALDRLALDPAEMSLRPLLWHIGLAMPATILLNTFEMELSARVIGARFGLLRALRMTIFASAANMLPLPGAAMVRIAGLSAAGGTFRAGGAVTMMIAVMWIGVALLASGAVLALPRPLVGVVFIAGGSVLTAAAFLWSRRLSGGWRSGIAIALVKTAMVAVSVIRIQLCLSVIGVAAPLSQVAVFAVSGVLGSAVSIVPAGLGVREVISAALAPLVALPAAAAFLATGLDRLVGMSCMLCLAAITALVPDRRRTETADGA